MSNSIDTLCINSDDCEDTPCIASWLVLLFCGNLGLFFFLETFFSRRDGIIFRVR